MPPAIVALIVLLVSSQITDRFFDGDWVVTAALIVGFIAYAPAHIARGICSGHGRFASYGVVMGADGASRIVGCMQTNGFGEPKVVRSSRQWDNRFSSTTTPLTSGSRTP